MKDRLKEEVEFLKTIRKIQEIIRGIKKCNKQFNFLILLSVLVSAIWFIGALYLLDNHFKGIQLDIRWLAVTMFSIGYLAGFMIEATTDELLWRKKRLMEELNNELKKNGLTLEEIEELVK